MTWHADTEALAAYSDGTAHPTTTASIEAHLLACAQCRDEFARQAARQPNTTGVDLDAIWDDVVDAIDAPRQSLAERLLRRMGVREHTARILAATPALRLSWLASITVALVVAVALSRSDEAGMLVQLVAAPLLPPIGVAVAYGAGIDPAYELGVATPLHGLRLVLLRTVAVVFVTVAAGLAMTALLPWSWTTLAWLLPSLGLAAATLALGTVVASVVRAAIAVDAAWAAGIIIAQDAHRPGIEGVGPATQAAFAALTAAAVVVMAVRRHAIAEGGTP